MYCIKVQLLKLLLPVNVSGTWAYRLGKTTNQYSKYDSGTSTYLIQVRFVCVLCVEAGYRYDLYLSLDGSLAETTVLKNLTVCYVSKSNYIMANLMRACRA